jgi:hypothetical protein
MAIFSDSPDVYITQWLKTATKGNVVSHKAFLANRLQFICHVCMQSLTTATDAVKSDGTVDYSLQEFVKIHAHTGGHKDEIKYVGGLPDPLPTAVTANFKKIDDKPENEAKIKAKLAEYAASLDDAALAKKIAELQAGDKYKSKPSFKLLPMKSGGMIQPFDVGDPWDSNGGPWTKAGDADAELAKAKAVENVLKLKILQDQIKAAQQAKIVQHVGTTQTTPTKKDKVLTQPVGRKFR